MSYYVPGACLNALRWLLARVGLALRSDLLEQRHHWRDEYSQRLYYQKVYREVLAIHNQSVLTQEVQQ